MSVNQQQKRREKNGNIIGHLSVDGVFYFRPGVICGGI